MLSQAILQPETNHEVELSQYNKFLLKGMPESASCLTVRTPNLHAMLQNKALHLICQQTLSELPIDS